MLLDLHVHSKYSNDAVAKPRTLLKTAAEKGVGFAITDHNNCNAWPEFKREAKNFSVPLVFGEEIKVTRNGKLLGELLILFMNEPIEEREIGAVIDKARQQSALVAAAHPFDLLRKPYFRGFYELPSLYKKLDAIEVFNSRTILSRFNRKAKRFALEHEMPQIAGSDAHTAKELGNALTGVNASTLPGAMKEIRGGRTRLHCRKAGLSVHLYSSMKRLNLAK